MKKKFAFFFVAMFALTLTLLFNVSTKANMPHGYEYDNWCVYNDRNGEMKIGAQCIMTTGHCGVYTTCG
jgi:hypothetical protein